MEDSKPSIRRRHGAELKARVLAACDEPGASVAQVAMAHGINANLVHKWRRSPKTEHALAANQFIELPVPASFAHAPVPTADIRIEVRRGPTSVSINWPAQAAGDCGLWLRELLK